jgi:hypothetical protein
MLNITRFMSRFVRTTLAIDDDVLAAAKHLAERERKSVGKVISALARHGLSKGSRNTRLVRNGVPLLSTRKGGAPVTLELVNQLRDELP